MANVNDLSVRQLQYVVALAETLGFHKAAAKCHVSQPALSAQIQQLEAVLGVTLFERGGKRVLITPAGQDVVARARRILLELDELLMAAARAREPLTGTLRIGVIPTVAPYLLPEVAQTVAARYPKLALVYREEKTSDLLHLLRDGSIDAGVVALEADVGDCDHAELGKDEFVAALPKGHPLTKRKNLSLSDLEDALVLLLEEGHCFRTQALALCEKVRARQCPFRATSLATLAQMVSGGIGMTLLPSLSVPVENRRAQLEIRRFSKPSPSRTLALIWRPRAPFADALKELSHSLRWDPDAATRT